MALTLSVLLACWNRPKYAIESVLEALSLQTILPDEVVLVDDGSSINTAKEAEEKYKDKLNIKYLRNNNPGNTANTLAYNIAIKNSTSELNFVVSSDIITHPKVVEEAKEILGEQKDDHSILGFRTWGLTTKGNRRFLDTPSNQWNTEEFYNSIDWRYSCDLPNDAETARLGPSDIIHEYTNISNYPSYFCTCFFKSMLEYMGGFNEDLSISGGYEDYDFECRLKLIAKPIWSEKKCFHLGHWHDTPDYYRQNLNPDWGIHQLRYQTPPVITSPFANKDKQWGVLRK
jgi:glycosyltransferase involved in cell wall biosynthesis